MFNGSETIFLLIFPYFFHVEISLYPTSSLTPAARGPALAGLLDFFLSMSWQTYYHYYCDDETVLPDDKIRFGVYEHNYLINFRLIQGIFR